MLYMQQSFGSQLLQELLAETTLSNNTQLALNGFQAELRGELQEAIGHYQESNHPFAKERLNEIVPIYLSITYPDYYPLRTGQQLTAVRPQLEPKQELITQTTEVNNPKRKRRQKRKTQYDATNYKNEDIHKCISELWDGDIKLLTRIQKISGELTIRNFAKRYHLEFDNLKRILSRLKRKGLFDKWPSLSEFGNAVVNTANQQQPTPTVITTPAKTFLPMQQLSQTRTATPPQLEQPPMEPQESEQPPMKLSKDAIRVRIHNLI